ncbi:G-protein coupled receptor Mth2 [Holothuria leucospilota]|uniref:G-protein coupled receptor Mth2 n=1 Tax=Holothuria leucospilota TaxID=206669 RepID=A0A9Q1H404_HOLLE|nr:G-protein coupled receptor Mth2 [Holothuria leucospilota]
MDALCVILLHLVLYLSADLSLAVTTTEVPLTKTSPPTLNPEDLCLLQFCSTNYRNLYKCRCDDMCGYYGDCCWHIANTKNMSQEYYRTYPPREFLQCRSLPGLSLEAGVNGHPKGYYTVSDCQEVADKILSSKCVEEPDQHSYIPAAKFLPVRDDRGILYKNVYCAKCNGVSETKLETWKAKHDCPECPRKIDILSDNRIKLVDPNCEITALYQWSTARSCSSFVNTCLENFTNIDVTNACRRYLLPGFFNNKIYQNPHCAACNGMVNYGEFGCISGIDGNFNVPIQSDLFRFWSFDVKEEILSSTVIPSSVEKEDEIERLSGCTEFYPQHLLVAVTIPNHRIKNESCPYFAKRLNLCIQEEFNNLIGVNAFLPWKQIVKFPNDEPFPQNDVLYLHIPQDLSLLGNWKQLIVEIISHMLNVKQHCGFQDMFLLRFCGNISVAHDISTCPNLHEFHSSEILSLTNEGGQMTLLNPLSLEPIKGVSWFGFVLTIEKHLLHTNMTKICQEDYRLSTMKMTTKGDFSNVDSTFRYAQRLPLFQQIFSDVCISLSILGLLITFVTYCIFPPLRNLFGITLMNFVSAFAIGQLLLHFATDRLIRWKIACSVVSIVAHFVWLGTFAWMTLLAWNLKATFSSTKVRSAHYVSSNLLLKYCCFGWVVPFLIVAICCVMYFFFSDIIPITYGLVQGVTCWIGNGWIAMCVVAAPLALSIFVNGIFFCMIIKGIRESKFRPEGNEDSVDDKKSKIIELLVYIKISALMGFVWTIGFFISFDESGTLWYTYYVLQALQGIFVMIFFALNYRVRCMWRSKLCKAQRRPMSFTQTRNTSV